MTFNNTTIIGQGTFLECIQVLKEKQCDAIYGPSGGILVIDQHDCLVYNSKEFGELGEIYFGVDDYLGLWRMLLKD